MKNRDYLLKELASARAIIETVTSNGDWLKWNKRISSLEATIGPMTWIERERVAQMATDYVAIYAVK